MKFAPYDDGRPLLDCDLDNIEAAAKGEARGLGGPFAHPADTLKLVAEVRRLRALLHQALHPSEEQS